MKLFKLISDIEFEAEDVPDACKKLIALFMRMLNREKEEKMILYGSLGFMCHNWRVNNTFEIPIRGKVNNRGLEVI